MSDIFAGRDAEGNIFLCASSSPHASSHVEHNKPEGVEVDEREADDLPQPPAESGEAGDPVAAPEDW